VCAGRWAADAGILFIALMPGSPLHATFIQLMTYLEEFKKARTSKAQSIVTKIASAAASIDGTLQVLNWMFSLQTLSRKLTPTRYADAEQQDA
jgi:hypothetical protein